MEKSRDAVSTVGGADGPTAIFIANQSSKLTLKQKLQRLKNKIKRTYVEKTINGSKHNMDEVIEYIKKKYGFIEVSPDSSEFLEEYKQMRVSFIIQYAPELLGEYAVLPELKSTSQEEIKQHITCCEERTKRAQEIPQTEFDIDFHKFKRELDNPDDTMDIIIEKKYSYISGGASGSRKTIKEFDRIYKDIYRYYGVTQEDINNKSERYNDLVRTLSQ